MKKVIFAVILMRAVLASAATETTLDVTEVRCREWQVVMGLKSTNFCAVGDMVPVDSKWWSEITACRRGVAAYQASPACQALFKEAELTNAPKDGGKSEAHSFLALTPTEFAEGFNRASQMYRFKYRLPTWPAKGGNFRASIASGITVAAVGIHKGDGLERVTVTCKQPNGCEQGLIAAALAVDPDIDIRSLNSYLGKRLQGQMEGQSMQQNGIYYFVDAGKKSGGIEMIIEASDEDD